MEMDKFAAALGVDEERLFPYSVRIKAGETGALAVEWKVVNTGPAKHIGYAVQWFAMSAVLAGAVGYTGMLWIGLTFLFGSDRTKINFMGAMLSRIDVYFWVSPALKKPLVSM